ncbi:hypothetical protein GALL_513470 [mine drainage metagenome]|uniref:Uncharacterized protein n=1 Tax=mine drainage metagenome TaxID=410659 RepID=A0A1J5P8L3_9ZZZZ
MVKRVLAHRDAVDGKDRKLGLFVVVTGVVAEGAFHGVFEPAGVGGIGQDVAFEHDFGKGGYPQLAAQGFDQFGAATAQQAGKLVFAQCVGHRCDGTENRRRVGSQSNANRVSLAWTLRCVLFKV